MPYAMLLADIVFIYHQLMCIRVVAEDSIMLALRYGRVFFCFVL